jgi:hypothetical protein
MLARASTKTFVSRIHVRQPSPKNSENSSLAGSLVSRGITVLGVLVDRLYFYFGVRDYM